MNKFTIPTTLILVLVMLWLVPAAGRAGSREAPKAPWRMNYLDGSGNEYRFWKDSEGGSARFEYSPVRPEESSTGMYSGGEPAQGTLSSKQVKQLWQRLHHLESDATLRITERMKGTGAFHIKNGGIREFIIADGPPLREWNQFLSAFRRGEQGLVPPQK